VDVAPVLGAVAGQTIDEQATLTFTAAATDADVPANTLSFSLDAASLAAGMTINAATGTFQWTPTEAQGGAVYPVTVTVTDNGTPALSDSKSFTVTVNKVNLPPTVTAFAKTVNEDEPLTFFAADFLACFSDPDAGENNTLQEVKFTGLPDSGTLALAGAPVTTGQVIGVSELGSLTYQGDLNYNGTETLTWEGSDGLLYSGTSATVSLTVSPVNDAPPVVQPIPDVTLHLGGAPTVIDLAAVFGDVDCATNADQLAFSALSAHPERAAVSVTGTLFGGLDSDWFLSFGTDNVLDQGLRDCPVV